MKRRSALLALMSYGALLSMSRWCRFDAAAEEGLASPWFSDTATRVRLVAGGADGQSVYAGVDIRLDDGWKTYWRHPGSSGVPPRFDWAGSGNVKSAEVLFPAPHRFPDPDGDTIGYKGGILLPVRIAADDVSKPVTLKLALDYGVCKDVCVPVQAELALTIPPQAQRGTGSAIAAALEHVPQSGAGRPGRDPELGGVSVELAATPPRIVIDATFPGDPTKADVFLEAPDGLWVPLAKPADGSKPGAKRFVVDLSDGAEIPELKGKSIRLTLVGERGQSETSFKFE